MTIVLDGTNGISTPDLESAGPITGTTGTFSGNVTLGSSVLSTPTGAAPSYTCRAWVNFNGTGTVAIRASGNVSSITDNGTGVYTVNFTTAMADVNYAAAATATDGSFGALNSSIMYHAAGSYSASACSVVTRGASGGSYDPALVSVAIFR